MLEIKRAADALRGELKVDTLKRGIASHMDCDEHNPMSLDLGT